jgi:DNA-binding IclR family transcriptional regulator
MPALSLPAPIMAELNTANAQRGVDFDGPHGREFQLWASGSGAVLMAELHPDGSVFLWRPLEHTHAPAATVDALRAYLANPA